MTITADSEATLGLAVIAKNEEATLPNLLASVDGAFDQVALLDTGSTDRTVGIFEQWAETQPGTDCRVGHFEWIDDFGAARNAANALLSTDWLAWADCDDVIHGAEHLRNMVARTPAHTAMISFRWLYGGIDQRRERIARRGYHRWHGRVSEGQPARGAHWKPAPSGMFDCTPWHAVAWQHSPAGEANQAQFGPKYWRNMRIIASWISELPGHPTPVASRAVEELWRGSREQAHRYFLEYLALPRIRSEFGAERLRTARAVVPAVCEPGAPLNYVLGRPPLTWLIQDEHPEWPPHPLCPDPGAALLDRRLVAA